MSFLHSALSLITAPSLMCRSNTLQLNGSFYIINSRSSVQVEVTLYWFVLVSNLLISSRPHIFLFCPPVLSSGDVCTGEMLDLFVLSPSLCIYSNGSGIFSVFATPLKMQERLNYKRTHSVYCDRQCHYTTRLQYEIGRK